MTVFVCTSYPELRILAGDDYVKFIGGKLELDPDEPGYDAVKAEAIRNPAISIIENETTCEYCGEVFTGKAGKAQLGTHKKANHFDVWQAEKEIENAKTMQREVKARAGFACDVCSPVQTFGTEADLTQHVRDLHAAPPDLDDAGNTKNEPDRRPGEVEPATETGEVTPTARKSTRNS